MKAVGLFAPSAEVSDHLGGLEDGKSMEMAENGSSVPAVAKDDDSMPLIIGRSMGRSMATIRRPYRLFAASAVPLSWTKWILLFEPELVIVAFEWRTP